MKFIQLLILLILAMSLNVHAAKITDDTLTIGKPGSSDNKVINLGSKVIRANEADGKLEFSNDGALFKKFGSGSGGGAGAISIIENGGFEDGISSGWSFSSGTVTSIASPLALLGETSAQFDSAAENDYLRTDYITVPPGLRGSACEARFLYTGFDRNVFAKVETESGVTLGSFIYQDGANGIPSHSIAGYESVFFKCPTEADITTLATNGNVRLVFYQGTATDAALGVVDDIHFGGLIGLVESSLPDVFSAKVSSTGAVTEESGDWINGDATISDTSTFGLSLNPGIFSVAPNCTADVLNTTAGRTAQIQAESASAVNVMTVSAPTTKTALTFRVICQKAGSDAKQSVQVYKSIPKISENVNSFVAKVSTAGTVSDEDLPWLTGCSKSGTNSYNTTCSIDPSIFTVAPNCQCTILGSTSATDRTCAFASDGSNTANQLRFHTTANAVATNIEVSLKCSKVSPDFKMPTVQPIIIGQVTNSAAESSLTNVRIESCDINNSGTASLGTASGLCQTWMESVTRTATGSVDGVFKDGTFSSTPVCTWTSYTLSAMEARIGPAQTGFNISTRNSSGTVADTSFGITCIGKR